MATKESRITAKGQISVPAFVRKKLGLAPGSRIEWVDHGDEIVVKRASRYSSRDIHDAVFGRASEEKSVTAMDDGIRAHLKRKHARG